MDSLEFTISTLPPGTHRITIVVGDGEFTKSTWIELRVHPEAVEPSAEPEDPHAEPVVDDWPIYIVIIVVILISGAFLVWARAKARDDEDIGKEH
jgi:hypothetical protein